MGIWWVQEQRKDGDRRSLKLSGLDASPLRFVCRRTTQRLYPSNLGCTALATGDFRMTRTWRSLTATYFARTYCRETGQWALWRCGRHVGSMCINSRVTQRRCGGRVGSIYIFSCPRTIVLSRLYRSNDLLAFTVKQWRELSWIVSGMQIQKAKM